MVGLLPAWACFIACSINDFLLGFMMIRKLRVCFFVLGAAMGLSACSTVDMAPAPEVQRQDVIAVLPMANYTETPEAGHRAASIAFGILQTQGHAEVLRNADQVAGDPLFGDAQTLAQSLEWARQTHARYALAGSVQEWRYKVGVDGEPAVGLGFSLIDLQSGVTVWSATGSRTGWSRSSLSGVAQSLARSLLDPLRPGNR